MDDTLIDMDTLREVLGGKNTPLHRATIHKHIKAGKLPKPLKIGGANRWLMSEIAEVIEAAKASREVSA